MKLRTRLGLAFVLMSVVPLTAITLYSYSTSLRAFRRAVEAEESAIAADMGKRMELVTTALSDRMDRISAAAEARDWNARDRVLDDRFRQQVAATLGEAANFVSRLQFVPSAPPPPPPARGGRHFPPSRGRGGPSDRRFPPAGSAQPAQPSPVVPLTQAPPGPPSQPTQIAPPGTAAQAGQPTPVPGQAGAPGQSGTKLAADAENLIIDLIPPGSIPPDAQAALLDLKGLAVTLPQLGQAGAALGAGFQQAAKALEQRAREEERRIEADRRLQGQNRSARFDQWINRMKQGKPLDIPVRQDGRLIGTMNAEISLDRVLRSVLAGRSRESGEIAFAIDAQNRLLTSGPADRTTLESLGLLDRIRAAKAPVQTLADDNWIVVAQRHPSGILFGIARPIGSALGDIRLATGRNLGLGLLAILVALVGIVPISSRMTRNISVLHSGVTQIAQGNLDVRLPVRSNDEIGSLAAAFNQMAQDLGAHQKLLAERERLRGELELCRQIQNEMLPKQPLRLGFVEIKGVSIPAREVGGDFFNYFLLPEGEVAMLVGDVSGKGVGAALLMANVQATLRARLSLEHDLAALADAIDHDIDESTPMAVYLTLFMGILDASHRILRYVNAGHNPQFVLRAAGGLDRLPSTGLPIAMFAGHGYKEGSVTLGEGDILFFYTDGITEVENEKGEMFGSERLEALLVKHHAEGVDAILARIEQEVLTFRGAADLFDDATMMVLRLGATPPKEVPARAEA
jgi:serine phosphatase RsbU (regulator of sigma subunit)